MFHIFFVMNYYVYILANHRNGTLYVGVTNDLVRRAEEHRNGVFDGFTKKYGLHKLVYYDVTDDVSGAIDFEQRLKKWKRVWKIRLIEKMNPEWKDLYQDILG